MTRIVITQPYIANYRANFYELLNSRLKKMGKELVVIESINLKDHERRGDKVELNYAIKKKELRLNFFGISFYYRLGVKINKHDVIVTEFSATNLNLWKWILTFKKDNVYLWGQVLPQSTRRGQLDFLLEKFLAKKCKGIFAYTDSGRRVLISNGISASKIFVVENSTDTNLILKLKKNLSKKAIEKIASNRGIDKSKSNFLFLGSLTRIKGLDFLYDFAKLVSKNNSDIRIIVGGSGHIGEFFPDTINFKKLGRVEGEDLVAITSVCRALIIPGAIGLVAVDALALGKTVITRENQKHGPEIEYLASEGMVIELSEDVSEFYQQFIKLNFRTKRIQKLPSIEKMVSNFLTGLY